MTTCKRLRAVKARVNKYGNVLVTFEDGRVWQLEVLYDADGLPAGAGLA